jgi:uncharacterized protein
MANRFSAGLMALAFCFIITIPAYAQDPPTPEKKALVKELMRLMNATSNSEAFANQMIEEMREPFVTLVSQGLQREFQAQKLSPAEQQRLKSETEEAAQRILTRVRAEFPKRVNLDELLDQVGLEVYGKHFTEEELKELGALYKSPTAQKFVRLLPQILAETLPKIEELMAPALTRLVGELITEEKKKLKAR